MARAVLALGRSTAANRCARRPAAHHDDDVYRAAGVHGVVKKDTHTPRLFLVVIRKTYPEGAGVRRWAELVNHRLDIGLCTICCGRVR